MYPEIEVMILNKELPITKHIEANYYIFWKQQNANITKIYSWYINQIWKSFGMSLKWL